MKLLTRTLAALAVAAAAGCATTSAPTTVAGTVARTPELSTLNRLIEQAGLKDTLQGSGPYTVFAPSDKAFASVPAQTMAQLGADKELLKSVLTFHVLPAKVAAADVKNGNLKTVQGANVAVAAAGTFVTVEDAVVQTADLRATNGVVHIVDRVLMPPKR